MPPKEITLTAAPIPEKKTLIVIGSPEKGQGFPMQFVTAASYLDGGPNVIWLLEETGYEMTTSLTTGDVLRNAPAGGYRWINQENTLVKWINRMPAESIQRIMLFAHGLPGLIVLRHGWPGHADYGLSIEEVQDISPTRFTEDAEIVLNSCNTASIPREKWLATFKSKTLAEAFTNTVHRRVSAWTGRTSYHHINRGVPKIIGSRFSGNYQEQWKEAWTRTVGRDPHFVTYGEWGKIESSAEEWNASPSELRAKASP